ncbi:hypothetical protein B0A48_16180 [Cryoendolithus antarcticus]|uniref:Deoxyribonuclease NucA/NucB domain-containing protein n=1 Tax=Cryoendolithus antarcticus TaxID=1507870 RepID=A0A1V8SFL6_9PEZI|nr:hypothetical protein B0A48_16180 [Cryoendolithus antarcticus]
MFRELFLVAVCLLKSTEAVTYGLICSSFPGVCNNKCYATYVAGKSDTFTWNGGLNAATDTARRTAAGTRPNPCCSDITAPPTCYTPAGAVVACTSPDEYPYISSSLGGAGAIIRCTGPAENRDEGGQYGGIITRGTDEGGCGSIIGCQIQIAFAFVNAESPFCTSQAGPNDGFQWTYSGGTYINAKRDTVPILEPHVPDPADFFPLHLRREFLLTNGMRVIVASRDLDKDWQNEIFVMGNETTRVVREYVGMEKSAPFRPANVSM